MISATTSTTVAIALAVSSTFTTQVTPPRAPVSLHFSGQKVSNPSILNGAQIPRVEIESTGQAYFWTEKWQNGEAAADRDFAAGRFEEFDSAEDAVAWLFGDED